MGFVTKRLLEHMHEQAAYAPALLCRDETNKVLLIPASVVACLGF